MAKMWAEKALVNHSREAAKLQVLSPILVQSLSKPPTQLSKLYFF